MKVFKLNETASIPVFATDGSAAFDLHANILENTKVRAYNPHNKEMLVPVRRFSNGKFKYFHL